MSSFVWRDVHVGVWGEVDGAVDSVTPAADGSDADGVDAEGVFDAGFVEGVGSFVVAGTLGPVVGEESGAAASGAGPDPDCDVAPLVDVGVEAVESDACAD